MADDDPDWSGGGSTVSMADNDSDEYIQPKKTRRRTSSRNRKKTLSDNDSSDSNSPLRSKRRRTSSHNKNKNKNKIDLDLAGSDSSDLDDTPPIIQITTNKPKKRRNSSNSKKSKPQLMQLDSDNDADDDTDQKYQKSEKKRKNRKRKSTEPDSSAPPQKKRRTSTHTNTNTNSSLKKPKKAVKLKGPLAVEKVRGFMLVENRPHSKNSAQLQLGEKLISSKEVEKAMDTLRNDGILVMKEFGKKSKTKIYWADQDQFEEDESEEQMVINRIRELEMSLKSNRGRLKTIKNEVNELRREPTDNELGREQQVLLAKYNGLNRKYSALEEKQKELGMEQVSKSDLEAKLLEFNKYGRGWKERKAAVMDMISQIFQDSSEKPRKILTNRLNGESDTDNEVDWENYKDMYKKSARLVQQMKDNERNRKRK